MTPGRTIRNLLSRLSAGEAITPDELRAAGLVSAVETILEEWSRRGLLAHSVRRSGVRQYAITPLGDATPHWD
jgi:hypothetical protein